MSHGALELKVRKAQKRRVCRKDTCRMILMAKIAAGNILRFYGLNA